MSTNEDYAYGQSYSSVFRSLCEQEESMLKKSVWQETQADEFQYYNYLGSIGSTKNPSRAADTAENTIVHYRRRVGIDEFVSTRYFDRTEALKMVADPTDQYIVKQVRRMNVTCDQAIIDSVEATSFTDKTGSTSTTYDSSMTVASGTSGLTISKIKTAALNLTNNSCPLEDRFLIISPDAEMQLVDDATVASIDYMSTKSLPTGKLPSLLGFTIIVSTLLPAVGSIRDCMYWHKDGILFVEGKDRLGSATIVGPRADKNNLKQAQTFWHVGATRMDESAVGILEVIE